jgi:hypothetical protein
MVRCLAYTVLASAFAAASAFVAANAAIHAADCWTVIGIVVRRRFGREMS